MAHQCEFAFKVIRAYLAHAVAGDNTVSVVGIAVQTYRDLFDLNPHLHLHAIVSDGCFLDGQQLTRGIQTRRSGLGRSLAI
jgi:hypothetical protein